MYREVDFLSAGTNCFCTSCVARQMIGGASYLLASCPDRGSRPAVSVVASPVSSGATPASIDESRSSLMRNHCVLVSCLDGQRNYLSSCVEAECD